MKTILSAIRDVYFNFLVKFAGIEIMMVLFMGGMLFIDIDLDHPTSNFKRGFTFNAFDMQGLVQIAIVILYPTLQIFAGLVAVFSRHVIVRKETNWQGGYHSGYQYNIEHQVKSDSDAVGEGQFSIILGIVALVVICLLTYFKVRTNTGTFSFFPLFP